MIKAVIPDLWPPTSYLNPIKLMPHGARAVTHLAQLRRPDTGRTVRGYVKHFLPGSTRGLVNEIIGWTLNRALQVPQPLAAVMVAPQWQTKVLHPAFVSLQAQPEWQGTPLERYNLADPESCRALKARLKDCSNLPLLVAADQLAINGDRNLGNFGFTGKFSFVVFDQSDILGGCDWSDDSLRKPTAWALSKLIDDAAPGDTVFPMNTLPAAMKNQLMHAVHQVLKRFYQEQAPLREALQTAQNAERGLALDAIWWRSLSLEGWYRDRLNVI